MLLSLQESGAGEQASQRETIVSSLPLRAMLQYQEALSASGEGQDVLALQFLVARSDLSNPMDGCAKIIPAFSKFLSQVWHRGGD